MFESIMAEEDYGKVFNNMLNTPLFEKIFKMARQTIQEDKDRASAEQARINALYKQDQS
jgi:hypothetical protein